MSNILNLNVKNFSVSSLSLPVFDGNSCKLKFEIKVKRSKYKIFYFTSNKIYCQLIFKQTKSALFYQDDIETNINDVVLDAQKSNHEAVEHATIKIQSQEPPKKK
ncbi:hypothetical protein BpHYR1_049632 [Brachionus plicatilis]|uniref:Uncharacterized protein n=1 Tax=Brachionus plicatilis TaxID=10195 RepID=A0A3M7T312_BRAPC|nr:hypothetical protein BpHYR1_049632 [Brachionus plicatilis]